MESGAGGGEASDGGLSLDARSLARFQRLKEESRAHPLQEDSEILGAHLALRLAALKSPISQTCKREPLALLGRTDPTNEVEKLLESISDEVRLQKSELPTQQHRFVQETFDSDVDNLVEWAKDAAALDPQLSDEEDFDGDVKFMPVPGADGETSHSDVDNLVEWAKDAAALDPQLSDEEDFDGDVIFMPVPGAAASIKRFTSNEVRMQKSGAPTHYRGLDKKRSESDVAFEPHLAEEGDLVFNGDVSNVPVPGTAVSIKKKDLIKEKKNIRWKFW